MNYRHIYHAGNFADVFKHVLLVALVESLLQKEKPFCYIDTHAGIGNYDLQQEQAQKTQESSGGIFKLLSLEAASVIGPIDHYLQIVKAWNREKNAADFRYYPGSPLLIRKLLRAQDQMVLTELHSEDVALLKQTFWHDPQVQIHHLDAYQALKAFLPPKLSRGLVLIDPPFEKSDEFTQIIQHVQLATRRWSSGIYAIWYPIKNIAEVNAFYQALIQTGIRKILCCEMHLPYFASSGLNACGMIVIQPPWQWKEKITPILPMLSDVLSQPLAANWRVEWLVPE
jgi:23S rRNA (adenine2030-N6)-methyltransferase